MKADQSPLIHEIIEHQARLTPARTAAIFRDRELNYGELIDAVTKLSAHLRQRGVGPECVVGVCLERSLEMLIAMLAVLHAGAAYLPLDPAFPAERLAFMVHDSRAAAVITETGLAQRFIDHPARIILIDEPRERPDSFGAVEIAGAQPSSLAYLMYTSGSTGTPKGVMVEHRNVTNFFVGMDEVLGTRPGVWLAVTSISFDISVLELLWTLARGFTVVIQGDEEKLLAAGEYGVAAQMERHRVTHLQCTPTMAELLVRRPRVVESLRLLRKLLLGGEALPPALAHYLSRTIAGDLLNMYGPTETTIWSTTARVTPEEPVTIGRPIANTQVFIVGEDGSACSDGETGEIYIGGDGVARGYWQRPELTAERFVTMAFGASPEQRLYRTGDLGRYRPDGSLEFLGRADQQIKIRGYRVEPGEIEVVLREHPAVAQAVVISCARSGVVQLAAYVVAEQGHTITPDELSILARRKLPEYMVPAAFIFLPSLPTTPNGKLDRKALPDPAAAAGAVSPIAAPATIIEKKVAAVLGDVLGGAIVGLHQNFFELGATSLIVAEAAATLREVLDRPLKITDLFAHPTVSALASFVSSRAAGDSASESGMERGAARRAALARRRRPADLAKDQT
jgi:amino acid adenylation domain-containing protein